jgi:hypothetical protein
MIIVTPQARAIAAFTLAVLLVLGDLNRIWFAFVLVVGDSYPSGHGGQLLSALAVTAIGVLVTAYALAALKATGGGATWDSHLAGAAVLVAAVGVLIIVLRGFGSVVHGSGSVPSSGFGPYGF